MNSSRQTLLLACLFGLLVGASCSPYKRIPLTWPELNKRLDPVRREFQVPIVPIAAAGQPVPYLGLPIQAGNRELVFQWDTGSSVTLLRESLRKSLKLTRVGQAEVVNAPEGEEPQSIFATSDLRLGDFRLREEFVAFLPDQQFDTFSSRFTPRVDGILGASLLHRGEAEIRGPSETLVLRPFGSSPETTPPQQTVFLIHIPDINGFAVPVDVEGSRSRRFLFDTGSNAEFIIDANTELGQKLRATPPVAQIPCRTIWQTYPLELYRLPFAMILAGRKIEPGTQVLVENRTDKRLAGSLGVPVVWSSERVILNRRLERATIVPSSPR